MAYSKTNWVDNTTPIDKNNLNKIEQGIYDNSLVVDAVTNTLNPTDTETYKTAELTEGQITDVIGVSDILIKGQTSQNGEPTPSSPVDVNVVSGSNVINTSGKNKIGLKNGKYTSNNITINVDNGIIKFSGTTGSSNSGFFIPLQNDVILKNEETNILSIKTVGTTNSQVATRLTKTESAANNNSFGRASVTAASNTTRTLSYTQTERETYKYFYIQINANQTLNFELYNQLEQGSTATTYEPHQGKELPLDLPVENLFDGQLELGTLVNGTGELASSTKAMRTINYIEVSPNMTYTLSNNKNYTPYVFEYDSSKTYISNSTTQVTPYTFTPSATTRYVKFRTLENKTENDLTTKFMLEKNIKATPYVPYGTDPIELCKIGNYQDYFYKSGSKWYLHKEIGKTIFNGSESWSYFAGNLVFYTDVLTLSRTNSNLFCNRFSKVANTTTYANMNTGEIKYDGAGSRRIIIKYTDVTSATDFKTWLASNNTKVYYPLETATDTEITNTTLISQLEAIYNAPLYEETNITQTNNDLPMVLDITACKDNINGIKAFIRK